jgi:hypothetical protein
VHGYGSFKNVFRVFMPFRLVNTDVSKALWSFETSVNVFQSARSIIPHFHLYLLPISLYHIYTTRPNLFACFWLDVMKRASTLFGVCFEFWPHSTICHTGVLATKIQTWVYCVHHICLSAWNSSRSSTAFVLNSILESFNKIRMLTDSKFC